MPLAVGSDVAKELHWACVLHMVTGRQLQSRKVANTAETATNRERSGLREAFAACREGDTGGDQAGKPG